jgi:hypothetical protein
VRKGRFYVNGLLYYAPGLGEQPTGQDVLVRCDPAEPAVAATFTHEGDFLRLAHAVGYRASSEAARQRWEGLLSNREDLPRGARRRDAAVGARREQSRYLRRHVRELRAMKRAHGVGEAPRGVGPERAGSTGDRYSGREHAGDGELARRARRGAPRPNHVVDERTRGMQGVVDASEERARRRSDAHMPSPEEAAELARRVAEFEAREAARRAEADWRPAHWASEWERYAWCERSVQSGKLYLLTIEDARFLEAYRARIGTA